MTNYTHTELKPLGYMATQPQKVEFRFTAEELMQELEDPGPWQLHRCWLEGKQSISIKEFFLEVTAGQQR